MLLECRTRSAHFHFAPQPKWTANFPRSSGHLAAALLRAHTVCSVQSSQCTVALAGILHLSSSQLRQFRLFPSGSLALWLSRSQSLSLSQSVSGELAERRTIIINFFQLAN